MQALLHNSYKRWTLVKPLTFVQKFFCVITAQYITRRPSIYNSIRLLIFHVCPNVSINWVTKINRNTLLSHYRENISPFTKLKFCSTDLGLLRWVHDTSYSNILQTLEFARLGDKMLVSLYQFHRRHGYKFQEALNTFSIDLAPSFKTLGCLTIRRLMRYCIPPPFHKTTCLGLSPRKRASLRKELCWDRA